MTLNRNYWISLIVFSGMILPFASAFGASPQEVEEVFFELSKRPRLLDQDWQKKVKSIGTKTYRVKKGDTLWKVSRKLFQDPFLWRKLWETNPEIYNPHELVVGTSLKYASNSRELASVGEVVKIPLVHLRPQAKNSVTNFEQDSVINVDLKNRFVPNLFILNKDETIFGKVTGAFTRKETPSLLDATYVEIFDAGAQPGQKFSVIQELTKVNSYYEDESNSESKIMRLVGEVQLLEKQENLWKVEIKNLFGTLKRDDKLVMLRKPIEWSLYYDPPAELQTRVLSGEEQERTLFTQGDIVLLDKGKKDGMQEGFVFKIWRDKDLLLKEEAPVEPDSKGEVRVIHVSSDSSIGYILRNLEPVELGDVLVPRQTFTEFKPRFHRETQTLELQ